MGIIKAAINAVGGGLADSWLEVIEPSPMGDNTLICPGQLVSQNGKSQNKKGSENIVSNGSVIHVYDNQMMILIDGGKIVDFTAEPGYFKVNNSSMPSLFCGQFGDSIKETFNRIKYDGIPSQAQRVFYINLQEIKGIPFGTSTPVNYFDNFYNYKKKSCTIRPIRRTCTGIFLPHIALYSVFSVPLSDSPLPVPAPRCRKSRGSGNPSSPHTPPVRDSGKFSSACSHKFSAPKDLWSLPAQSCCSYHPHSRWKSRAVHCIQTR